MIGYLTGTVKLKEEKSIILLTNGVGYAVFVPLPFLENLEEKEKTEMFIYTNVSENAIDLYGFPNKDELAFFKQLISVSGVGPKTALEILIAPMGKVKAAIFEGNVAYVSGVKGIGKKTAERLCLELKDKIDPGTMGEVSETTELDEDTLNALLSLGYDRRQAEKTLSECPSDIKTTEDKIKWCLKNF